MKKTQRIFSIQATKVLGDERRLAILRLLMRSPATLSQLGRELEAHPAKVRHHLKLLEDAGFVELTSTRIVGGFVEKYYEATASAYLVNLSILPLETGSGSIVMMGSHDPALEVLAGDLRADKEISDLYCVPVGSLDGLIALRQGLCHLAGCHLPEGARDEFNQSYVQHLFPGYSMTLLALGMRLQGLVLSRGNPKSITGVDDLARNDVTIINRQSGSGTRLWLDKRFSQLGIKPTQVVGYEREARTHHEVSSAVMRGEADAGIGVLASARMLDLAFVPLFEERYDLVFPTEALGNPQLFPLFDRIHSPDFREAVTGLGGYDTGYTGKTITIDQ